MSVVLFVYVPTCFITFNIFIYVILFFLIVYLFSVHLSSLIYKSILLT